MFPICQYAGRAINSDKRFCKLNPQTITVSRQKCQSCPHASQLTGELVPICTPPLVDESEFPACVQLGQQLRTETVKVGCCGTDTIAVHGCNLHKETTAKSCHKCRDRETLEQSKLKPLEGPAHLIWQVYPRRDTKHIWQAQQEAIRAAWDRFDGKKLIAIAVDDSTAQDELDLLMGWDAIKAFRNDPKLWELPGWRWAMLRLSDLSGITVRLHSKGVVRGTAEQHLDRWWKLAYESMMNIDAVRESLENHVITGEFRRNVPATNLGVPWHYSGSFYAFRHDAIFLKDWEPQGKVAADHYVEAWPALVASRDMAGCLRFDGVGDLYRQQSWRPTPQPVLQQLQPIPRAAKPVTTVQPPSHLPPGQVAIVIAGRNNAQYLREAIESALNQTYPCEVVYADDCSFDDSVKIAREYESRGLRVMPSDVHKGVTDARNRGLAATTSPYLVFLDSDDWLDSRYAETMLSAMQFDTPFAYAAAHCFGEFNGQAACSDWADSDIIGMNFVNSSSMFARWAVDLSGGWIDTQTAWDWDLALRCMKFGWPARTNAILHYRRYRQSWSFSDILSERMNEFRLRRSLLSVCATADAATPNFKTWLAAVVNAVRQRTGLRAELILCDVRNNSESLEAEAKTYRDSFESIRVLKYASVNRLKAEAAGNFVWFVSHLVTPVLTGVRHAIDKLVIPKQPPLTANEPSGVTIYRRQRP